ncbi:hypothetical protein TURU_061545 [Turdus rufiventris]|nr:hypothetical protein TURU_061545 [Turdus rufiventris]
MAQQARAADGTVVNLLMETLSGDSVKESPTANSLSNINRLHTSLGGTELRLPPAIAKTNQHRDHSLWGQLCSARGLPVLAGIQARSVALLGKQEISSEMSKLLGDTKLLSAAIFLGHSSLLHGKLAASNLLDVFSNDGTSRKLLCPAAKDGVQYMGFSFLLRKV